MKYEVYLVTCVVNGKQYVGKTVYTGKDRWWSHCSAANKKSGSLLGARCSSIHAVLAGRYKTANGHTFVYAVPK